MIFPLYSSEVHVLFVISACELLMSPHATGLDRYFPSAAFHTFSSTELSDTVLPQPSQAKWLWGVWKCTIYSLQAFLQSWQVLLNITQAGFSEEIEFS